MARNIFEITSEIAVAKTDLFASEEEIEKRLEILMNELIHKEDAVLALYETIMPGVEAVGFDCNQIIPANGAIHCIAMKVPALPETIACGNFMGDVNLDGRTNIYDILKLVDLAAGIIEPELCVMESGDLHNDGIYNYYNKNYLTFNK